MKKDLLWFERPIPTNVWDDKNKRDEYRTWLEKKFSISSIYDWTKLRTKDFVSSFQKRHHSSSVAMVRELVPECNLRTWEFRQTPSGWWKDKRNQQEYFEWLNENLGIQKPEDWYSKISKQIHPSFIKQFGSFQGMLKEMVPEFDFKPWKFAQVQDGWWKKRENQQIYMTDLGERLGYKSPEDWYALKYEDIEVSLMKLYSSPEKLVRSFFPDYDFKTWKFNRVPPRWWNEPKNQQEYINALGEELGFSEPQDWYKLKQEHLSTRFLSLYNGSPSLIVQNFFPNYKFKSWLFETSPRNSWDSYENQKEYIEYLGEKLGFTKPEDWYKISYKDFESAYLRRYSGSRQKILETFFPEFIFLPWKFDVLETGMWKKKSVRKHYFLWLSEILGYKSPQDWYRVKFKDFKDNYGEVFIGRYYGYSTYKFVQDMIPDFNFDLRLFDRVPANYWRNPENRIEAIKGLGKTLKIRNMEEWYNVTADDFRQNGLGAILQRVYANSPEAAVRECFSNYKWDSEKFGNNLKRQRQVFEIAKEIFGENNVVWNHTSPLLRFRRSKRPIQLDVYIPLHALAIEYQGVQHYKPIEFFGGEKQLKKRINLDNEKRVICQRNGISLIEIPYTWNGDKSEIRKIISDTIGINVS